MQVRNEISTDVAQLRQEHESINMDLYSLKETQANYTRMFEKHGETVEVLMLYQFSFVGRGIGHL